MASTVNGVPAQLSKWAAAHRMACPSRQKALQASSRVPMQFRRTASDVQLVTPDRSLARSHFVVRALLRACDSPAPNKAPRCISRTQMRDDHPPGLETHPT